MIFGLSEPVGDFHNLNDDLQNIKKLFETISPLQLSTYFDSIKF